MGTLSAIEPSVNDNPTNKKNPELFPLANDDNAQCDDSDKEPEPGAALLRDIDDEKKEADSADEEHKKNAITQNEDNYHSDDNEDMYINANPVYDEIEDKKFKLNQLKLEMEKLQDDIQKKEQEECGQGNTTTSGDTVGDTVGDV